ncbi:MAG: MFS transporter [Clostridia bacterium]|nr:MFS transporter [Clostridia bacterium]
MVRSLDKKWKEIVFAMSGFGPNLLMVLLVAYFTDAVNPVGLAADINLWSINGKVLVVMPLFSILWTAAKAFDGIIDVPLASLTDSIKSKFGRRRTPIAIAFLPMVISYFLLWLPSFSQAGNTAWIICWAVVFFAAYTMCLIAFYGSLSTVCTDEGQRLRVSSYKSFFDTISYCVVYALLPAMLRLLNLSIDKLALYCIPLMVTMIIPLFLIKEGAKYTTAKAENEKRVGFWESLKLTLGNKMFMRWMLPNCCAFFGLQMFLTAQNTLISGVMGLGAGSAAILNTFAFAPVPMMLYLFNKLKKKKGIRFTYQSCLLSFGLCILCFNFAGSYFWGDSYLPKLVIGAIGGIIGSWAIGAFFMMPYLIPTQIAAEEERLTGKNHAAMYFAIQAVLTSIVGAVSSGLVYENLKMWTKDAVVNGVVAEGAIKCGVSLVPLIVSIFCIGGFFLCFLMPKDYTTAAVAKALKLQNHIDKPDATVEYKPLFEKETIFVNIVLSILSGFLFVFIWLATIANKSRLLFERKRKAVVDWLLMSFIPFFAAFWFYKNAKLAVEKGKEKNIEIKDKSILYFILCCLFLHFFVCILYQKDLNRFAEVYALECKEKANAEAGITVA